MANDDTDKNETEVLGNCIIIHGYTRDIRVGFRDRGMGRGDFGLVDGDGNLLAEIKDTAWPNGGEPGVPFILIDARANALLFAAAPKVVRTARALLAALMTEGGTAHAVAALEAALKEVEEGPPAPVESEKP